MVMTRDNRIDRLAGLQLKTMSNNLTLARANYIEYAASP